MIQPKPKEREAQILVVDDEQCILDLFTKILSREGYDVITACSAEEALQKVQSNDFDLIITDVYMPGDNGFNMLREIRKIKPSIRTIVMTGYSSTETIKTAFECRASGFLLKPFRSVQQILTKVQRTLILNDLSA